MSESPAFGARLRSLMAERRVTQEQIAGAAGVSIATVSRWRRGLYAPDLTQAQAIADVLGVKAADLFPAPASEATGA